MKNEEGTASTTSQRAACKWFPMRVRYSSDQRLLALKAQLDDMGHESYVPLRLKKVGFSMQMMPAISNLIFIHIAYSDLSELKQTHEAFTRLSYIMHNVEGADGQAHSQPLTVPDRQMTDFIHATSVESEKVIYLDNMDFACKPGAKVQITEGLFAGVTGVVKHIQKNLCVVVPIKDVVAVAITHVPRHHLRYLF